MTNPIAVSQRARELFILLMGLDATDDFESIRNGAYDHWKKMQAVARFEAEIRADERETAAKVAEDHGYSIEISKWMAMTKKEHGEYACHSVATAIRNQKDHDHEPSK